MAKEIIKANVVAAPTLFIGAGGTGCKILKEMAQMCPLLVQSSAILATKQSPQ